MARRAKVGKAALLMGAAAVAAGVLLKRDKVTALLGQGSQTEPVPSPGPAPAPAPANYDAPGPPENTATPVPAPEPFVREEGGSIDEAAEVAAAAATDAEGSSDYERQIEDAIAEAAQPFAGERVEPLVSEDEPEPLAP